MARAEFGEREVIVLLLHLSGKSDYFIFAGSHLGPGDESGLKEEERLGKNAVVMYAKGHFGIFDLDEFMDMTLSIEGKPKERLHRWVKKFRAEKIRAP